MLKTFLKCRLITFTAYIQTDGAGGSSCNRRQLITEVCAENERRKQKEKRSKYFYRIVVNLKTEAEIGYVLLEFIKGINNNIL